MARKVFWVLWMTVWPAVALYPHLVTAQAPRRTAPRTVAQASVALDEPAATETTPKSDAENSAPEVLPDASTEVDSQPPATSARNHGRKVVAPPLRPSTEPAELDGSEDQSGEELLPAARSRKPSPPRQPAPSTRATTRTSSVLTSQAEQAQKLIHERALLRSQQRQARLETRNWSRNAQRTGTGPATWQPHLTETNWLAGSRRSTKH